MFGCFLCALFCFRIARSDEGAIFFSIAPGTVDAIKTTYFAQESKQRLDRIIRYLGDLEHNGTLGKLSPEDSKLFKSVVATYNN